MGQRIGGAKVLRIRGKRAPMIARGPSGPAAGKGHLIHVRIFISYSLDFLFVAAPSPIEGRAGPPGDGLVKWARAPFPVPQPPHDSGSGDDEGRLRRHVN